MSAFSLKIFKQANFIQCTEEKKKKKEDHLAFALADIKFLPLSLKLWDNQNSLKFRYRSMQGDLTSLWLKGHERENCFSYISKLPFHNKKATLTAS